MYKFHELHLTRESKVTVYEIFAEDEMISVAEDDMIGVSKDEMIGLLIGLDKAYWKFLFSSTTNVPIPLKIRNLENDSFRSFEEADKAINGKE